MQQVDNKKQNALLKLNAVTMNTLAAKTSSCNTKTIKSHTADSAQTTTGNHISSNGFLFLIEFSAGALGGVVSRTALVFLRRLLLLSLYFFIFNFYFKTGQRQSIVYARYFK